jgi:hypothetical protein
MSDQISFTLLENKTRKTWLISFLIYIAFSIVSTLLIFFDLLNGDSENLGIIVLTALLISALVTIPSSWITYHCAYKKRGTAWLMWIMIAMPLRELVNFSKGEWNQIDWSVIAIAYVAIAFGVEIFFWVNCLRLYEVNNKRLLALQTKKE